MPHLNTKFVTLGSIITLLSGCDLYGGPNDGSQANAGCLLEHNPNGGEYRVLMVQQHNGEWNFPGGAYRWREAPTKTAERETQEETGVAVSAIELVRTFDNGFQLFKCEPKGNKQPNPEDSIEVLNARWVNPSLIPAVQWRFPYQRAWLMNYLNEHSTDTQKPAAQADVQQPKLQSN
ncbi:MAG: NUDIX hydrolase [Cellvibrionaceae bacterium]|nr:NUDIX hydrolase [Cellvibrionaceae bacterium]MCV6626473.1 NUDIX hydrolase [Cellvibrionaceae bacterium]